MSEDLIYQTVWIVQFKKKKWLWGNKWAQRLTDVDDRRDGWKRQEENDPLRKQCESTVRPGAKLCLFRSSDGGLGPALSPHRAPRTPLWRKHHRRKNHTQFFSPRDKWSRPGSILGAGVGEGGSALLSVRPLWGSLVFMWHSGESHWMLCSYSAPLNH